MSFWRASLVYEIQDWGFANDETLHNTAHHHESCFTF